MARDPNVVIIESPRTEYVDRNVTIHEHRAPTDQSVALLKELEQAARDKVEHSINVGGNGFECVVHIHKSAIDMDTVAVAIFKLNGVRRVQLNLLRDFTSATISRIFIADFKQVASDAEFKQLINEISQIGSVYAAIPRVGKGDIVNLDWVPGKGWLCFQNGKQITTDMVPNGAINSELAFQIYLRMYIGQTAPENYRNGLLGIKD